MDDSIVLLSSMSPKIKTKSYIKSTSILALNRNIRQSSICDKLVKTIKNDALILAENSSSCGSIKSTQSSCSINAYKILNETPIVLSDTFSETSDFEEHIKPSASETNREFKNQFLSSEKVKDINVWMDRVNRHQDCTTYSELSTINGDDSDNFQPKEKGNAITSTFIESKNTRFDEYFLSKRSHNVESSTTGITKVMKQKLIIEDSFETSKDSKFGNNSSETENCISEKSFDNMEKARSNLGDTEEIQHLLDSIYGTKWRQKQDQILPKSECKKIHNTKVDFDYSERKPVNSLYKNSYIQSDPVKSDDLLKRQICTKQKISNFKKYTDIYDSNTPPEPSHIMQMRTKTRLVFTDSSGSEEHSNDKNDFYKINDDKKYLMNFDKINNDEKENFNLSVDANDFEEKIRKKTCNLHNTESKNRSKTRKKNNVLLNKVQIIESPKSDETTQRAKKYIVKSKTANKKKSSNDSFYSKDEDECDRRIHAITFENPTFGFYSFLASLSGNVSIEKCDMSAQIFRNNFKTLKDQLLEKLFKLYNENIFDKSIPEDTLLEWNDRMRGTAGFCYCRKITLKNGTVERTARIALSTKVVDCAERLRDTLIHEMCHAAAWIINCVSDGHGKYWKNWAFKAMKIYPELPPIKRCHNYVINTKYTYKCTGCGYSIGRHSKSLDIERKRCGYCYGKFEVLLNKVSKKGENKTVPATPKKELNGFALYVKENYGVVKTPILKHGEVMKILGQNFQKIKIGNKN